MISRKQIKLGKEIMAKIKSKIKIGIRKFITVFFSFSYLDIFSLKKSYQTGKW